MPRLARLLQPCAGSVALLVLLLLPCASARAALIYAGTSCTLADAITAANDDVATGSCSAGSGADTIRLTADVTLTAALPGITGEVLIQGQTHTVARDAAAADFRVFHVDLGASLTLEDLTVSNGRTSYRGGGVWSRGALIVRRSTFSDNYAGEGGAIHHGFGGGGTLSIHGSTISGNRADGAHPQYGGGIYISSGSSAVEIVNTTISGNTAFRGGGIYADRSSSVTITNSTIASNTASPAGLGAAIMLVGNSTSPASASLANSLLADNFPDSCFGLGEWTFVDGGNNLDDDGTCPRIGALTNLDPTLADNGGPTFTHALLPGSSAINAAGACSLGIDQRYFGRPAGACDSGAYEYDADPLEVITVGPGGPTPACTLGDAMLAANLDTYFSGCPAGSGADTIRLTADVTLATKLDRVYSEITIEGGGFTVERSGSASDFGIFEVDGTGDLTLEEIVISNGVAQSGLGGGGLLVNFGGTALLDRSTVSGNSGNNGGGVSVALGSLTVRNSTVTANTAWRGGGIAAFGGVPGSPTVLSVINSTVSGNEALFAGGGVRISTQFGTGTYEISNSTIANNTAEDGGGIASDAPGVILTNTLFGFNSPNCYFVVVPSDGGGNFADAGFCGFPTLTNLDPALADNGGPTLTHALLAGSSAIDAAGICDLTTDQRYYTRDVGPCDSGAYEFGAVPSPCTDGLDNDDDGRVDFVAGVSCLEPGGGDCGCESLSDVSERDETGTYECDDGVDNDGDYKADYVASYWCLNPFQGGDCGCESAADTSERDQTGTYLCDDGIDNDGDLRSDYDPVTQADPLFLAGSGDPVCTSATRTSEVSGCQNGLDDDQPTGPNAEGIDFDGGASLDLDEDGFIDAQFNPETPAVTIPDPQCVGRPAVTERTLRCGLGFELAAVLPPLLWARRRRARRRATA